MKKHLLITIFVAFASIQMANAQLEQGNLLLGGSLANLSLGLEGNGTSIGISPNIGYFIADNIAVGGSLPLSYSGSSSSGSSSSYTAAGLGGNGRYYFGSGEPIAMFGMAGATYSTWKSRAKIDGFDPITSSGNDFTLNAGVGGAYFLNESIGLEGVLGLYDITGGNTRLGLNFGFQIYFSPN